MAIKYGRPIESRVRVVPAEAKARAEAPSLDLTTRMRRNRRTDWARRMVALAGVGPGDLVLDIGAGRGALTAPLVRAGTRVVAIEIEVFAGDLSRHLAIGSTRQQPFVLPR